MGPSPPRSAPGISPRNRLWYGGSVHSMGELSASSRSHEAARAARSEQAEIAGALYRAAARGDVDLSVDGHRVRFHRMRRQVEALADLGEGEVRGEVREQTQLRSGQRGGPGGVRTKRLQARTQVLDLGPESSDVGLSTQQRVDLAEHRPGAARVGEC